MIKFVKAVLILVLFAVVWMGSVYGAEEGATEQAAAPLIVLNEPIYHFGEVSEGEVVKHDFRVLNNGTAPLEIKKVKPG
jgi:hypothetical protein